MEITVLFFSVFRDLAGSDRLRLTLPEGELTVADVVEWIHADHPALREWREKTLLALNCRFADGSEVVGDGDELALMPPVQGG